jgi:hypothetical protein
MYLTCTQFAEALSRKGLKVWRQQVLHHVKGERYTGPHKIKGAIKIGNQWNIPAKELENFEVIKVGTKVVMRRIKRKKK